MKIETTPSQPHAAKAQANASRDGAASEFNFSDLLAEQTAAQETAPENCKDSIDADEASVKDEKETADDTKNVERNRTNATVVPAEVAGAVINITVPPPAAAPSPQNDDSNIVNNSNASGTATEILNASASGVEVDPLAVKNLGGDFENINENAAGVEIPGADAAPENINNVEITPARPRLTKKDPSEIVKNDAAAENSNKPGEPARTAPAELQKSANAINTQASPAEKHANGNPATAGAKHAHTTTKSTAKSAAGGAEQVKITSVTNAEAEDGAGLANENTTNFSGGSNSNSNFLSNGAAPAGGDVENRPNLQTQEIFNIRPEQVNISAAVAPERATADAQAGRDMMESAIATIRNAPAAGGTPAASVLTQIQQSARWVGDGAQALADSVLKQISIHLRPNSTELRLHLNPAELGELKIRFVYESGKLRARVRTELESTADLVRERSGELRSAMRDAGIEVFDLDVGHGERERASKGNYLEMQESASAARANSFANKTNLNARSNDNEKSGVSNFPSREKTSGLDLFI